MKLDAVSIVIIALLIAVAYGFVAFWAARWIKRRTHAADTDDLRRRLQQQDWREHQDWRIKDME